MTLAEDLQPFFDYIELLPAKAQLVVNDLEEKEQIRTKHQLFLLDDKSWKNIAIMDTIVRDAMEAWINDDLQPLPEIDEVRLENVVEPICERVSWCLDECSDQLILLSNLGISKFKHLRPLKKETLYKAGLPVLLVQELRAQTKIILESARYQASGSLFKLPIVGVEPEKSTIAPDVLSGMAVFAIKDDRRMVRQIDGRSYEYDRKCPHKGADLTYVNHFCPLPLSILGTC